MCVCIYRKVEFLDFVIKELHDGRIILIYSRVHGFWLRSSSRFPLRSHEGGVVFVVVRKFYFMALSLFSMREELEMQEKKKNKQSVKAVRYVSCVIIISILYWEWNGVSEIVTLEIFFQKLFRADIMFAVRLTLPKENLARGPGSWKKKNNN